MAQFHMSVQAIGRSGGRSATAAAAYRAAQRIVDQRTGEIHDYSRKQGVLAAELVLPGGAKPDRSEFWNEVEQHHKRGDAVLAREFTLALPHEMAPAARQQLALDYGRELADRYGVAVDVALHEPDKDGDQRNYHAHVMLSACAVAPDGTLGKKAVELDPIHCQRAKTENFAERERPRWAELVNQRLADQGIEAQIDHRSLADQGIDRVPTQHLGVAAVGFERRTGLRSDMRARHEQEQEAAERLRRAAELGQQERAAQPSGLLIVENAEAELRAALAERDRITQEVNYEQRRRLTAVLDGVGREMEQPAQLSPARLEQFEAGLADMLRLSDLDSETRARAEHIRQAAENERKRRETDANQEQQHKPPSRGPRMR